MTVLHEEVELSLGGREGGREERGGKGRDNIHLYMTLITP